jgi:ATP adenylyltransferase/5',5'''-P-1,P-4-tetraphosphate phosphorylase II
VPPQFVVTIIDAPAASAKDKTGGKGEAVRRDAFATVDRPLLVAPPDAAAFPRHVVALNKFPVVAGHMVVYTKEFAPQEAPMDVDDVTALWRL